MKIVLRAHMTPFTGYGNCSLGLAEQLIKDGALLVLDPIEVQSPWPASVAGALLNTRLGPAEDMYICHAPPHALRVSPAQRRSKALRVAWSTWEQTTFDTMAEHDRVNLVAQLIHFNVVVVYDEVSRAAFTDLLNRAEVTHIPVVVARGTYRPFETKLPSRGPVPMDKPFNFCMVGELTKRKNPLMAVQAFREAREQMPLAELHLKTTVPGAFPDNCGENVYLYHETYGREQLGLFMRTMAVMLAPSAGEALNLPALEMLSTGGTVIATNWGGHRAWLSNQYAYPLKYDEVVPNGADPYSSSGEAYPDIDDLVRLMVHCYNNRADVYVKGQHGKRMVEQSESWERCVKGFVGVLLGVGGDCEFVARKYNEMTTFRRRA